MYPSLGTAPKGSTVHFARSTPTPSRWATNSTALDGSANEDAFSRATSALRPGATGSNSAVIPSFCKIPATYFAAASSLPGGLVVLILINSASQVVASRASAEVSPGAELVCGVGGGPTGVCPAHCGTAMTIPASAQIAAKNAAKAHFFNPRVDRTCFPSPLPAGLNTPFYRSANVLLRFCYILTCHLEPPRPRKSGAFQSSTVGILARSTRIRQAVGRFQK